MDAPSRDAAHLSVSSQTAAPVRAAAEIPTVPIRASGALRASSASAVGALQVVALDEAADVEDTVRRYRQDARVAFAEPDYVVRALETPNDSDFAQQWGMTKIEAPLAWDVTHGSSGVLVAVLDCGIYTTGSGTSGAGHPDINGKVIAHMDFTGSATANDECNHGTHVAGIVAATTNNAMGVAGVGYNTRLLNGKVLDDSGNGTTSTVISGIGWAVSNGAKVINLSLGTTGSCTGLGSVAMQNAIDAAWDANVVIVASAGNSNLASAGFPANCNHVLAVAATTQADGRASFSNYGTNVQVAAPGVGIYSTLRTGSYGTKDGTSQAAPHVAGLVGSSRVDLQACKLEYSIVSPK